MSIHSLLLSFACTLAIFVVGEIAWVNPVWSPAPESVSAEYMAGWCAGLRNGWRMAAETVQRNRDHWRQLARAPVLSHQEVMNQIDNKNWIGPFAPRRLFVQPGPAEEGPSLIDSVDLYVLLPDRDVTFRECPGEGLGTPERGK